MNIANTLQEDIIKLAVNDEDGVTKLLMDRQM